MLFNAPEFLLVFLPLTLAAFHLALRVSARAAIATLLLASLIFYASWDPRFLALLLGSTAANFMIGRSLAQRRTKALLAAGVSLNLLTIGVFKYADLFTEIINTLTGSGFPLPNLILPLAISFFTFQQIAYLVDCYQGRIKDTQDPLRYALFVAFFPQLIAGPIVHHREVLPQFATFGPGYRVSAEQVAHGLFLIIVGLFKKVIIADNLSGYTDPAFADVSALTFFEAWNATLAYSLQLYFDFSAYGEIAMGLGLLFGIALPLNFNSPYKARNIQEFWRRWHITLGRFLRNYLYIPLGGSRRGLGRLMFATTVTLFLGGLWHGAAWHYVLWGLMHGAAIAFFAGWSKAGIRMPGWLALGVTFLFVSLAWVMFRAPSVADALHLFALMFGAHGITLPPLYQPIVPKSLAHFQISPLFTGLEIVLLLALVGFTMTARNVHEERLLLTPQLRHAVALGCCVLLIGFNLGASSTFAYFVF